MPLSSRTLRIAAAAVLTLLLGSCSKPPADALLGPVPADTPYVFASNQPMPAALQARLMANSAMQLDAVAQDWQDMLAQLDGQQPPPPLPRLAGAVAAELQGHLSPEGLEALGLKRDARSVFYGLGLFPVLRLEIADPVRVEALLARIEQRSELIAPRGEYDGTPFRRIVVARDWLLIIAVQPKHLVAGLLPRAGAEQWLPLLLGKRQPDESLAGSQRLAELRRQYGFDGHGEGYVDVRAVVRILTGQDKGPYGRAWQAVPRHPAAPSPACQRLADRVAAQLPRLVMGVTEMDEQGYALAALQETSPALGARLQQLVHARPLPGMGSHADVLFSLGVDIEPAALRDAMQALLDFLVAEGGECEWVDAQRLAAARPQLNLMLGPMLNGFKGVYVQLTELAMDAHSPRPDKVEGGLLLAVDDPRAALSLAGAMLNPALLDLQLPLDGTALAVPMDALPPDTPPLHLAARPGLLAIAVGEGGGPRATALLTAPVAERPILLSSGYDLGRFMTRMTDMMALMADRLEAQGETQRAQALREQLAEMQGRAGLVGRLDMTVAPEAGGLMLRQRIRLQ